jgi:hypothetical protein
MPADFSGKTFVAVRAKPGTDHDAFRKSSSVPGVST